MATQWNFAADRATGIDSAVFGTAIAASARLATQTGMVPITSRASNDRNVGTEAPNGERDAHGKRLEYCTAGAPVQGSCVTKSRVQADKHGISGVFRLDSKRGMNRGVHCGFTMPTGGARGDASAHGAPASDLDAVRRNAKATAPGRTMLRAAELPAVPID